MTDVTPGEMPITKEQDIPLTGREIDFHPPCPALPHLKPTISLPAMNVIIGRQVFSSEEEMVNIITHAMGLGAAVIGMIVLLWQAAQISGVAVLAAAIYGVTLLSVYLASTLYHASRDIIRRRLMQTVDHCAIFLLIGGSYTPFAIFSLGGWTGWGLFALIWVAAIAGIIMRLWRPDLSARFQTWLFLALGWVGLIWGPALVGAMPSESIWFVVAAGITYTGGVVFYLWESLPHNHGIWHLFVIAGSVLHFFSVSALMG